MMKIFAVRIEPMSPFGTPLKGDTFFGHFCWQAAEDPTLLNGGLDHWLAQYGDRPFAVFSSAWPTLSTKDGLVYALQKPLMPANSIDHAKKRWQRLEGRKEEKRKKWLLVDHSLALDLRNLSSATDSKLFELLREGLSVEKNRLLSRLEGDERRLVLTRPQPHNSINRLTMTTGTGQFAPFTHQNHHYAPGLELTIFVGIDTEACNQDGLQKGIERIGAWGFGRDATAGLGKFKVMSVTEMSWPPATENQQYCLTLGPTVPSKGVFTRSYATPFTRFGKHGGRLAGTVMPYKKPVVMADDCALFQPQDRTVFSRPYIGEGVRAVSAVDDQTVMQGYSLYLPC